MVKNKIEYSFRFHRYCGYIKTKNMHSSGSSVVWTCTGHIAWTLGYGDINLNIAKIKKWAIRHNIPFNTLLSHLISHEIVHNIIEAYESEEASFQFDNICYTKNSNLKQWFGGMA